MFPHLQDLAWGIGVGPKSVGRPTRAAGWTDTESKRTCEKDVGGLGRLFDRSERYNVNFKERASGRLGYADKKYTRFAHDDSTFCSFLLFSGLS